MIFLDNDVTHMKRKHIGTLGEMYIASRLREEGFTVHEIGTSGSKKGDLLVASPSTGEAIKVEVKTARLDSEGRYQACLHRKLPSRECTNVTHSDILILVLVNPRKPTPQVMVIPVSQIRPSKQLRLPRDIENYHGFYAQFVVKNRLSDSPAFLDLFSTSQTNVPVVHTPASEKVHV